MNNNDIDIMIQKKDNKNPSILSQRINDYIKNVKKIIIQNVKNYFF